MFIQARRNNIVRRCISALTQIIQIHFAYSNNLHSMYSNSLPPSFSLYYTNRHGPAALVQRILLEEFYSRSNCAASTTELERMLHRR